MGLATKADAPMASANQSWPAAGDGARPVAYPQDTIRALLVTYVGPVLLGMGLVGNALFGCLMVRYSQKRVAVTVYLVYAALLDTILLSADLGNLWLDTVFHFAPLDRLRLRSDFWCQLVTFVSNSFRHFHSWIIGCLAIEVYVIRTVDVFLIRKRTRAVLAAVVVLVVCLNTHFFWSHRLERDDNPTLLRLHAGQNFEQHCYYEDKSQEFQDAFKRVWPVVDAVMATYLPTGTVLVFALLYARHERRQGGAYAEGRYVRDPASFKPIMRFCVVILWYHLALSLPRLVLHVTLLSSAFHRPSAPTFPLTAALHSACLSERYVSPANSSDLLVQKNLLLANTICLFVSYWLTCSKCFLAYWGLEPFKADVRELVQLPRVGAALGLVVRWWGRTSAKDAPANTGSSPTVDFDPIDAVAVSMRNRNSPLHSLVIARPPITVVTLTDQAPNNGNLQLL